MRAAVGIVGGYGAVGRVAARTLRDWSIPGLRIGGRRLDVAQRLVDEELGGEGEAVTVDVDDPDSLARFCAECRVVLNCAGPSYRTLDTVARAALSAGAGYVDAGGDDPVHERLRDLDLEAAGVAAVLSAGMSPGLTALVPRWLAASGFDECNRLTAFVAARDRFTAAAAGDYLLSLGGGYGEPLAAWLEGRRAPRALEPLRGVELPFFSGAVTAYPYLTTETERLARALGLEEVRWYNAFDADGQILNVVVRLQASLLLDADLDDAAAQLIRAADIDLFGRGPRQQFLMQLDGVADGQPLSRTAVLRARGTYQLTGVLSAFAARAVLRAAVPWGLHYAADVLDPVEAMEEVRRGPGVGAVEMIPGALATAGAVEEGAV